MMSLPTKPINPPPTTTTAVRRIGCVGYLNAKPLIEGLEAGPDPSVRLDVPSKLLGDLVRGEVDIALCPVIDYYRCDTPLVIVPVGCIACDGPTLTVRLFSRVPIPAITQVHADRDSHTSVALLTVLLEKHHGIRPAVVPFDAHRASNQAPPIAPPQAMLLIGDKVVNDAPSAQTYPHQMDLGESWKQLTGLPFVFAVWMARRDRELGDLPGVLDRQRERNAARTDAIADRHAKPHGWSSELARKYLRQVLSYRVGDKHLQAIERFAGYARELGLIEHARPLDLWRRRG